MEVQWFDLVSISKEIGYNYKKNKHLVNEIRKLIGDGYI